MNESIYFLSSNGENFQPEKSTRFDHRGQRTLVVVLKGLTASKSQAAGKQVDGKNSWRDAEGKRIPIVDLFCLFFPMFFSASCLASSCFFPFFLLECLGSPSFSGKFLTGACCLSRIFFAGLLLLQCCLYIFFLPKKKLRKSTMEKKRKKGWLEKFHNWPSNIRYQ